MSLSYGDESTIRAYNGMGCMMIGSGRNFTGHPHFSGRYS